MTVVMAFPSPQQLVSPHSSVNAAARDSGCIRATADARSRASPPSWRPEHRSTTGRPPSEKVGMVPAHRIQKRLTRSEPRNATSETRRRLHSECSASGRPAVRAKSDLATAASGSSGCPPSDREEPSPTGSAPLLRPHPCACPACFHRRQMLLAASSAAAGAASAFLLPGTSAAGTGVSPSTLASPPPSALPSLPPRCSWQDALFASSMATSMGRYEAALQPRKAALFASLAAPMAAAAAAQRPFVLLDVGVGTGPNLAAVCDVARRAMGNGARGRAGAAMPSSAGAAPVFPADAPEAEPLAGSPPSSLSPLPPTLRVIGVDPNLSMRPYALASAAAAGLPPSQFSFVPAVAEALPLPSASVDAVLLTLVLCSVADVRRALREIARVMRGRGGEPVQAPAGGSLWETEVRNLRSSGAAFPAAAASQLLFVEHVAAAEGSALRQWQGLLDPLQQLLADGCHLTRETGREVEAMVGEGGGALAGVEIERVTVEGMGLIAPHVIGRAWKI